MKAICAVFDYGSRNHYNRLADVLERSWHANSEIPLDLIRLEPPETRERHASYYSNTKKLRIWREQFDQDTIFVDADMLCLRCPASGFDYVEDIGLTDRTGPLTINGGVMFMKYTKRGRAFMKDFEEVNSRMLVDVKFHEKWQEKYAGINQSAIGYLIENEYTDYNLVPEKYNLCDNWDEWRAAHLIHVKGHLRKVCLRHRKRVRMKSVMTQIAQEWASYE